MAGTPRYCFNCGGACSVVGRCPASLGTYGRCHRPLRGVAGHPGDDQCGLLYGNRAFLIGRSACGTEYQLWRLANISAAAVTGEPFTRDEAFDLQRFARRSFGTFQEQPVAVVLRFAAAVAEDVAEFVFHPDQAVERNADGSMTVRFTAGGIKEICWHLVTWGTAVTVEQPACLRQRLAEMCATLAAHHGAAP